MPFFATVESSSRGSVARRVRSATASAWTAACRRPPVLTFALILMIVYTFVRLQVGMQLPALRSVSDSFSARALILHRFHVLATSTIMTRDVFMVVSLGISLFVTMGTYEVVAGHLRAAALALAAAVLGPVSVAAGLGLLTAMGSSWADSRLDTLDFGASAIVAACSGAIAAIARVRLLTVGLLLFLLGGLALHHQLADWEHLLTFPWGYLSGRLFKKGLHRLDPMPRRLAVYVCAATLLSGCAAVTSNRLLPAPTLIHTTTGAVVTPARLISTSFPTPSMGGTRRVLVLLPPGYDGSSTRFPVVVLLHGDPGNPEGLMAAGRIEQAATAAGVAPFIAVIPDGHGPVVSASWFANIPRQAVGTAVSVDLRRWATSTYRTTDSWSYAGVSSGGFAAAYLPLIDPSPVHAVCGLGGDYDGNIPVLARQGAQARAAASAVAHAGLAAPLTVVAYGLRDAVAVREATVYIASLRAANKRVVIRTYPGAHTWNVWAAAFLDCFRTIEPSH